LFVLVSINSSLLNIALGKVVLICLGMLQPLCDSVAGIEDRSITLGARFASPLPLVNSLLFALGIWF
jgi:hypothetical protein